MAKKSLLLGLLLGGCSLAPAYQPPAMSVPAAYKEGPWQPAQTAVAAPGKWWQAFGDPALDALEDRIEAGNLDLAAASARYEQSVATSRIARADLFPQVGAAASIERDRTSANAPRSQGHSVEFTDKVGGASLAYEIDLFGRIRNQVASSKDAARAAAFDVDGIRLGLQSQLAQTYFDLRGLDARIVLLRRTIEAFQRAFDLTDTRHSGGISSGVDVSRAQSQLSSAKAELSNTMIDRARDEHAIAVLVGATPSGFSMPVADAQVRPPSVIAGLPSTLLERRPDIAAAERRVAAANARIGVARAAWFPSITLGASAGFETTGASWLSVPSSFWGLGPFQAALALFDGGRRAAGVKQARAQFDEATASYRQTVLVAFREVEDDLAAQRLLVASETDQAEAAKAAERTRDLAFTRYRDGAADYLEVVIAQTAALDAERALLVLRARQLQTASDTYRALGGAAAS
ncbi:efflux transporter outer membrane subunit [Sphingomonas immobilis]|uniref:Efflux transporter outer membrane subunit n=1 Tax=Sphingomonas immobilis TaxID=3063997 RepID=A0ABT9A050_9SPHN|nr:efflux transporter outer membrane subunit [Sphingomonas sp. CA1-15]MDO7843205.1 efflux transporter outer membrane subunit [Sphingomonas sp. CA1-15]